MKARQAKKLLCQLLSKQVEVLRIPPGCALALRVPRATSAAMADAFRVHAAGIADHVGIPVVIITEGFDLTVIAQDEDQPAKG